MRSIRSVLVAEVVSVLLLVAPASIASAQGKGSKGEIAVVITYKFKTDDRAAIRETMATSAAPQFEKWRSEGVFKNYLILFSSYAHMNDVPWDAMVVLDFPSYAETDNWKRIERIAPGGLPADVRDRVEPLNTSLAQILQQQNLHAGVPARHVYAVSPYKFRMGAAAGVPFVQAYVLPQLEPFVRDRVLAGYGLYQNLHDLSDWSYLLISEYADTAAFMSRNKAASRTALKEDPAWQALHAVKALIRDEMPVSFCERLLAR